MQLVCCANARVVPSFQNARATSPNARAVTRNPGPRPNARASPDGRPQCAPVTPCQRDCRGRASWTTLLAEHAWVTLGSLPAQRTREVAVLVGRRCSWRRGDDEWLAATRGDGWTTRGGGRDFAGWTTRGDGWTTRSGGRDFAGRAYGGAATVGRRAAAVGRRAAAGPGGHARRRFELCRQLKFVPTPAGGHCVGTTVV